MMLASRMMKIGSRWALIQAPVAGLRRVHSVLDSLSEPRGASLANNGVAGLGSRIGRVEFRRGTIGYGAATILSDVSMALRAGQLGALAGPGRCGETTPIYDIP